MKKGNAKTGVIYATKKLKRVSRQNKLKRKLEDVSAWMPDEVVITLDGETKGLLLMIGGWTTCTSEKDKACKRWPLVRLQRNLSRLEADWAEDFGKGWRLEIR